VVERLEQPWVGQAGSFRIDSLTILRPFQGHRSVRVDGVWQALAPDTVPAGSYLVPTDQRLGMVAAFLLEPASEDGYTHWNYFDRGLAARGSHPVRRLDRLPNVPRTLVP
jgi:hypothetical protein